MKDWAVLFDLDGTLVITERLKPLRDSRNWPAVYAAFGDSELLDGTREMLAATALLAEVGVVTMAPRPYAERLLRHHELALPVLVAYHDASPFLKPHARPIQLAAQHLGLATERVIYVGDELRDVQSATRAGAHAIVYRNDTLARDPEAAAARAFTNDWAGVAAAVREITGV